MVSTFNSIFQFWMHRINAIYSIFNLSRNCRKKFSFIVFVSIGCYMDTYLVWGQRIEGAIMLMGTWHLDQLVCPHANGEFYWQEKQYDGKHLPSFGRSVFHNIYRFLSIIICEYCRDMHTKNVSFVTPSIVN